MPHKVSFEIEAFSGEDERYKAQELNVHGPLVKGWQSQRFCLYPQVQPKKRYRLVTSTDFAKRAIGCPKKYVPLSHKKLEFVS